jgi:hypothetical protein
MKSAWPRIALGGGVVTALAALAWGVSRDPAPPARVVEPPAAESAPAPTRPAAPAPAPPRSLPVAPKPAAGPDESQAMGEIRTNVTANPERALALIDAADKLYPTGAFAEERLALRIDSLVKVGRIGAARDAAEQYLARYPKGSAGEHIERLTGVHPRPPIPLEAQQQ